VLAQLEQIYANIEQAADQVEVVRIMEASTIVLKGLHAEAGGTERVEDVVEELKEEMNKVDEVGKIIAEVGDPNLTVDDGEVDDELEAMERDEKEKKDEAAAQEVERQLAALDKDHAKITAERERERRENVETERSIEESIARLEGMSLGETQAPPTPEKNGIERSTILAT
jgi:charged multivesicular body protein 7